ncbi:MAG: hypothetical protein MK137_03455 [Rickettsiales bacterium]|nr:hypothetical protein [Rickettsiales bacterium]
MKKTPTHNQKKDPLSHSTQSHKRHTPMSDTVSVNDLIKACMSMGG